MRLAMFTLDGVFLISETGVVVFRLRRVGIVMRLDELLHLLD